MRQGDELAGLEALQHFTEQLARQLSMTREELIYIDAVIGEIASEWPQSDMGVGIEIAFAQLDKSAEGAQALHRANHRLTSEGIQNDIDTLSLGMLHNVIGESERSGVKDVVRSQIPE